MGALCLPLFLPISHTYTHKDPHWNLGYMHTIKYAGNEAYAHMRAHTHTHPFGGT